MDLRKLKKMFQNSEDLDETLRKNESAIDGMIDRIIERKLLRKIDGLLINRQNLTNTLIKNIISKLILDFIDFFDPKSEYGSGYLDAISDVCDRLGIAHERDVDTVVIKE